MTEPHSQGLGSITPDAYIFQNPDKGFAERSLRNGLVTHLSGLNVRMPNAQPVKIQLRFRERCVVNMSARQERSTGAAKDMDMDGISPTAE